MSMSSHRRSGQPRARVSLLTSLRQLVYRPRHRGVYRPQPSWRTMWKTDAYGNPYLTMPVKIFLPPGDPDAGSPAFLVIGGSR